VLLLWLPPAGQVDNDVFNVTGVSKDYELFQVSLETPMPSLSITRTSGMPSEEALRVSLP
jgi:hypothetical protein